MASSHDQHDGASVTGHEDPETVADARAGDDPGHDGHGHDGHLDHGHGHGDGHAVERSGWVLIPLGVGVAIGAAIIALFGVQSDPPERTDPIGATEAGGGHAAEEDHASDESKDDHGTDGAEDEADAESPSTTEEP